jgi:hypothetical protein
MGKHYGRSYERQNSRAKGSEISKMGGLLTFDTKGEIIISSAE